MKTTNQATITVFEYHERTKHFLNRYAAGPGGLDWADQPDPFRRYRDCERIALPRPGAEMPVRFNELNDSDHITNQPLTTGSLGLLLELAFGLSAWKQYGSERWALRCNPSSGNLHPTEAYLITTVSELLPAGVYHYVSHDHALETRCLFDSDAPDSGLYLALTSIHWREAWKYGERAYRYCQHDIGHALGSLRYAAAVLGWSLELLAEYGDAELAQLLGLNRPNDFNVEEGESPDLICRIRYLQKSQATTDINALLRQSHSGRWFGRADRLSRYHRHHWPVIDQIAMEAQKPRTEEPHWQTERQPLPPSPCSQTAARIIRQRRSAQRFDALTPMPLSDFSRLLSAILPACGIPLDAWRWPPQVHLLLFVHRVEQLEPGLYLLPRKAEATDRLQAAKDKKYDWRAVESLNIDLPLYRIIAADCRRAAKTLSCHQDIAGDGAFSVAMLAEFRPDLETKPWLYRRLFWETGLIGQILYLEAEAASFRGTGIGCFFDDSVHELLGFKDKQFQSLYHFTVGMPLDDLRLQTLPAYGHL